MGDRRSGRKRGWGEGVRRGCVEGKSWRCAYFMRLLYTHHQFSVSPLTFHGHYSPAEAFGAGAAWRTRNRCSQLFFYLPSSTFSSFISSILPPPPPVFLSFNGLTATTGFEWGAFQLFIGIRVFPFSGSTRYDPLTGFVRRADIYEDGEIKILQAVAPPWL